MRPNPGSDLRRAISRQTWLANRARNAMHRPAFIGAVSIATFALAIGSMVAVPRTQRQQAVPVATSPRPDTLGLLATIGSARLHVRAADSAVAAARQQAMLVAQRRHEDSLATMRRMDSLGIDPVATRDSLQARTAAIDRLLLRAQQAPLPMSYRAVASLPELRDDPRVLALLDTLNEIERERDAFGAVGGVDPIFVALTTRANDVGRTIAAIAAQRRSDAAAQLAALEPAPAMAAEAEAVDTLTHIAARDSVVGSVQAVEAELARRRAQAQALDAAEARERERANAIAPPLALLAAAFVLSAVLGFGIAFFRELRRPHVSNAQELERYLGVRVLSRIETAAPSAERGRREADRAAPPYFDPGAEGYQLAYLGLATGHPAVLTVTVTGDDPVIAAVVACNLAAVAAEEARSTLVLDLDPRCSASAALRARVSPGLTDVARGELQWPDVTVSARVGRDKSVDLVPRGDGSLDHAATVAMLERDGGRLARYYDAIVALAAPETITAGLAAALPSRELVYTAQPGVTPLRELRRELEQLVASGADLKGIVLWESERPLLATPRESRQPQRAGAPVPARAAT